MIDIFIRVLGLIFVLVALHRIILKKDRKKELIVFGLPKYSDYLIILIELVIGILLLLNVSYKYYVLTLFLLFFIIGCIIIFIRNYKKIMNGYKDIWTFQPTAMSFAMHLYIIFIVLILLFCK
jgi:small-conductance mechanosensitive channel